MFLVPIDFLFFNLIITVVPYICCVSVFILLSSCLC